MHRSTLLLSACLGLLLPARAASISGTVSYDGQATGPIVIQAVQTAPGNNVLKLDGDADYVIVPDLTDLSGSEITIQYWFQGSTVQSAVRIQAGPGWIVTGWNYRHIISNDSGTGGIPMGDAVTDGKWHQVTMTWKQGEPSGFVGYLDGQMVSSKDAADTPIPNHAHPLHFGAFQGVSEFANGRLDEISVWERALSPEEVQENWYSRLDGDEEGLLGYWTFEDGSADDSGPYGYHGELRGDSSIEEAGIPGLDAWHSLQLDAPGAYLLDGLANGGGYRLTAFVDENGNGLHDEGEPWGEYSSQDFAIVGDLQGADLEIQAGPSIESQPEAVRVASGQTVQLEVAASGSPPLSYQWSHNGIPLSNGNGVSGADTATLTIGSARTQDTGSYVCRVSNQAGEDTSQPALVRVVEGGVDLSGTVVYDGMQQGPVRISAARIQAGNKVLRLDGEGDYAITTLTDLSGPEITIQYWFRGESVQSAVRQQSAGYIVAGWNGSHILSIDQGTNGISAGGEAVTDGNWHHLAMTWKQDSPGGFRSYLDGLLVAERNSASSEIPNLEAQVHFGSFNGTAEFMNGDIDEIAIWDRALTESEIATGWFQPLSGEEEGLIGYWTFDDGQGEDLSLLGNHAELRGDAMIVDETVPGLGGEVFAAILDQPGSYALETIYPGSNYEVTAYMDVNGNGGPDTGEPVGAYAGNPFDLSQSATGIDILLAEPPSLTGQPHDVRAASGSVSFEASASGTAPLEWQWMKDGEDLADNATYSGTRTRTLTVSDVDSGDAGLYSVRVSNVQEPPATSREASLTVVSGPAASISGSLIYTGVPAGRIHVSAGSYSPENLGLRLDGSGDYAVVEDLTDLSGPEITIQYWFRGADNHSAIRQQSGSGYIVSGWNGKHILSNDQGTDGIPLGWETATDGDWHHLATTWEFGAEAGFRAYLDGRLVGSRDSADQDIPFIDHPLHFGAYQGTSEFATGELDEIAIWDRALDEETIRENWNKPLEGGEEGLIGLWKFDEGEVIDSSPYLYHGSLMGDAAIVPAQIPGFSGSRHTDVFPGSGSFSMPLLPRGDNYQVTAFVDVNGNYRQDEGEPAAAWEGNPFSLDGDLDGIMLDLGGEVVEEVELSVSLEGGQLVVSWPGGGVLYQTSDLVAGEWVPVEGASGGSASIQPAGDMRFYQLR